MSQTLSTSEVASLLDLTEAQVRGLVRCGLCTPSRRGRRYAYTFQDLVVLRAAEGLLRENVPVARIRRAVAALLGDLPEGLPVSALRMFADRGRVAVRDGETAWQPETGQTLLNFDVDELLEQALSMRQGRLQRETAAEPSDADRARKEFERALDLEGEDPPGAMAAYRRALDLDESLSDARVNLGRLLHEAGRPEEAVELYRLALRTTEDDPVLHFNLALAVEDTRGAEEAVPHYERALELDPEFADAHYNLAGLCEQLGRTGEAVRHYHAYKRLTGG